MNEYPLQFIAFGKIVWVAVFALLYGIGGISGKYWRRYVGAFWMGLGVALFGIMQGMFQWWHLVYPILLSASLSIGYGVNTNDIIAKIRKRAVYGLALGISAVPLLFNSHLLVLFGFHVLLCMSASIVLGAFNPVNARSEETLIAILSTVLILFLI